MASVEAVTFKGLSNALRQIGADVRKVNFTQAMKIGARVTKSDLQQRFNQSVSPSGKLWPTLKFQRPRGGNKPLLDTGRLRASLAEDVDSTEFTVGTAHPGASILNSGGVIKPKKGKFLAIPLSRQAQLAGSPLRMKKLGVKFGPKGGLMFERRGKGKRAKEIPHFALAKQVRLPARPFIGFAPKVVERITQFIVDAVKAQIRKG